MFNITSLVSAFKWFQTPVGWVVIGAFGIVLSWGGWNWIERQRLESEILLYEQLAVSKQEIQQLRESIFENNQQTLQHALTTQNNQIVEFNENATKQFDLVLLQLTNQQKNSARQFDSISRTINNINVGSCQELVDALIDFSSTSQEGWTK